MQPAPGLTTLSLAAIRSRLRSAASYEVSTRKQVGDAESMINEEGKEVEDSRQEL